MRARFKTYQSFFLSSVVACVILTAVPLEGSAQSLTWLNPLSWFSHTEESELKHAEQQLKEAKIAAEAAKTKSQEATKNLEAAQTRLSQLQQQAKKPVVETVTPPPVAVKPQEKTPSSTSSSSWLPSKWFGHEKANTTEQSSSNEPTDEAQQLPIHYQAVQASEKKSDELPHADLMNIETEKGTITIKLFEEEAPQTVANFKKLVNNGFYNRYNMKFHRVIPGFVAQTGDPTGTGAGGSKETVPLEVKNHLSHDEKGVVAMARGADLHSATSQFYITLAPQRGLDGKYSIFGKVIAGLDVLDKIEKGDMLYSIKSIDASSVVKEQQPNEHKGIFSKVF